MFDSLKLFFKAKKYLFFEEVQVIRRYYKGKFIYSDLLLKLFYLFSNPYRICRKFLQKKGQQNIYAYGETPLTTLESIASSFEISSQDVWLELGAGRGRGCLWIAQNMGCRTIGVEWIPFFVKRARWIVSLLSLSSIEFKNISIEKADFSEVSVVYLYSTCMDLEEIRALIHHMKPLPRGAKVITVSEPLDFPSYTLIKSVPVSFPWGETEAFLHQKVL